MLRFQCRQQRPQIIPILQRSQPWRVWRGEIHHDITGQGPGFFQADQVIISGFFHRCISVFANIDSQHTAKATFFNLRQGMINPFIIKPHAINNRLMLWQTEQAGFRVTRLWSWCQRTHFDETKTQRGQTLNVVSIFIQTRSQPQGIGKRQPHNLHW